MFQSKMLFFRLHCDLKNTRSTKLHMYYVFIDCIWSWLWTFQLEAMLTMRMQSFVCVGSLHPTHPAQPCISATLYAWMNTNLRVKSMQQRKKRAKTNIIFLNMCESSCGRITVFYFHKMLPDLVTLGCLLYCEENISFESKIHVQNYVPLKRDFVRILFRSLAFFSAAKMATNMMRWNVWIA